MATRSPATVYPRNFKGSDWYEPTIVTKWTAQKAVGCPAPVNSAQIYGHDTWNPTTETITAVAPYMPEYPA